VRGFFSFFFIVSMDILSEIINFMMMMMMIRSTLHRTGDLTSNIQYWTIFALTVQSWPKSEPLLFQMFLNNLCYSECQ